METIIATTLMAPDEPPGFMAGVPAQMTDEAPS
jgi:hypothetical protein